MLRERVAAATQGDSWIADGTYHTMIGDLVFERVGAVVWLDLPVPVVLWRLVRRTHLRSKHKIVLWNGNVEGSWRESFGYLIWPAFKAAFRNRRTVPERLAHYPHLMIHRLRSDRDVREFVHSIQATPVRH